MRLLWQFSTAKNQEQAPGSSFIRRYCIYTLYAFMALRSSFMVGRLPYISTPVR